MSTIEAKRFVSPYDDPAPEGAEGWEELYPYYLHFRADRREFEEGRFWFADLQHWPTVFKPFDTITVEFAIKCLGQYNTRHLLIPPANGIDYRVHNGYVYMSPVPVPEEDIPARVPHFAERAGHYFENWPTLLENWETKIRRVIGDLEALEFEPLPDMVDLELGQGRASGWTTRSRWRTTTTGRSSSATRRSSTTSSSSISAMSPIWTSSPSARRCCPGSPIWGSPRWSRASTSFSSGPTRSCASWPGWRCRSAWPTPWAAARSATTRCRPCSKRWPVLPAGRSGSPPGSQLRIRGSTSPRATACTRATGSGATTSGSRSASSAITWRGSKPATRSSGRPSRSAPSATGSPPSTASCLPDDEAREVFDGKLGLARVVFPYVEDHNFYIEHWSLSIFWRKIRQLGQVLADAGFWGEADDIFYVRRDELQQAVFDYGNGWAVGVEPMGPYYWPAEIARRKRIIAALELKAPAPAMNEPPSVVTEPFTIMLYGITSEAVSGWLNAGVSGDGHLGGMAASPGVVEGVARVVGGAEDLSEIQQGEVLVTRITAPSWGPVFGRIAAAVTDIGGMMSHAAIVCREYGLPAVTGTGSATTSIRTGQRVRVDGSNGTVTVLDD